AFGTGFRPQLRAEPRAYTARGCPKAPLLEFANNQDSARSQNLSDPPKYRIRISDEAKDCLRDYDTSKFEGRLAASPTVNEMSTPARIGLALAASIISGEASMPVTTAPRRHIRGEDYHQGRPEPTDCPWANGGSGSETRVQDDRGEPPGRGGTLTLA